MRRAFAIFLLAAVPALADVPSLTAHDDDGAVALRLEALRVEVLIRGHLSRTTFDLTFRNDTPRELEGDFTFPLGPDAEVSDVGLYFDGKLRHAVAVERQQARAAYLDTVHRRVDPILAEWNPSSRAFRFRVYPIPAKGTKVVHFAYDQELPVTGYDLDLRYGIQLASFELTIDSDEESFVFEGLAPKRRGGRWSLRKEYVLLDAYVDGPVIEGARALLGKAKDEQVWYGSAPVMISRQSAEDAPASHVTLLIDTSASAAQRDGAKLQAFLSSFLARQQPSVVVDVVPFHIDVEPARRTSAAGVESRLAGLTFRGATNLAGMLERLPSLPATSRVVVVTDGIETLGDAKRLSRAVAAVQRPVTVVNGSPQADDFFLARLARKSGGTYVDLTRRDPARAAERAVVNVRSGERIALHQRLGDAGRQYLYTEVEGAAIDLVRRAWARERLRELLEEHGPAADEVLAHGKKFGQITPRTSLLVLDSWRDYERHDVPMPPELAAERDRQPSFVNTIFLDTPSDERPPAGAAWFLRGVVQTDDGSALPGVTLTFDEPTTGRTTVVSDQHGQFLLTAPSPPASFTLHAELAGLTPARQRYERGLPSGSRMTIRMTFSAITEAITVTAASPVPASAYESMDTLPAARMVMAVPQTGDKQRIADEAQALRNESPELAVRVLTDLAEAYPDDAPLLRIIARMLEAWGRADLAKVVLARATELAPDEPQNAHQVAASADLHVDVMWDSNYTDVDLHVLEPAGEEVFYGQLQSKTGGRLHKDITDGYGPETYTHPSPTRGPYELSLVYYNADLSGVSLQTLAHVVVWRKGTREDHLVTLTREGERRVVGRVGW